MIRFVLAVRDKAADAFGQPIFSVSTGQSIRSFGDEVLRKAPDNNLSNHPDHFSLWHLASFDDASGAFTADVRKLCEALDFSQGVVGYDASQSVGVRPSVRNGSAGGDTAQ